MGQYALVKVRFSEHFDNLIQIDVELNGIDIEDNKGKDVTLNWHFDDFDANKTFWTDSNSLEM